MKTHPDAVARRLGTLPVYAFLVQFPVVCFSGALLADYVYWKAPQAQWETFSVWLLAIGCLMAGLAGIAGLIAFARNRALREAPLAWPHALLSLVVAVLSVVNALVHSRDGYTAVVPQGLTLSCIVVVLMMANLWIGRRRSARVVGAEVRA